MGVRAIYKAKGVNRSARLSLFTAVLYTPSSPFRRGLRDRIQLAPPRYSRSSLSFRLLVQLRVIDTIFLLLLHIFFAVGKSLFSFFFVPYWLRSPKP